MALSETNNNVSSRAPQRLKPDLSLTLTAHTILNLCAIFLADTSMSLVMAEAQCESLLSDHFKMIRNSRPTSIRGDARKHPSQVVEQELYQEPEDSSSPLLHWESTLFLRILLTTAISSILLASDYRDWVLSLSPTTYDGMVDNRASAQIIVQLLSNVLALYQVTAMCTLINRATRLRFNRTTASIDELQFWSYLCTLSMSWRLPFRYFLPLVLFISLTLVPSALWVGALSPIFVTTTHISSVLVPSYENASPIREYPSEFENISTTQVRNTKGVFTYRVGITMEGALLSTAASATTVDGSLRRHVKLDDTGFTYIGRSYGVGASAGLTDPEMLSDTLTTTYSYQETVYNAKVQCIYNASTDFLLY